MRNSVPGANRPVGCSVHMDNSDSYISSAGILAKDAILFGVMLFIDRVGNALFTEVTAVESLPAGDPQRQYSRGGARAGAISTGGEPHHP